MTHFKQLSSKLISLLVAFAMIIALMPAISLPSNAEGITYESSVELTADEPKYSSKGWTWDGKTLHFFGSDTYNLDSSYIKIRSTTDGGAAVIDISGSLTVNIDTLTARFIDSYCSLVIKGAGKITASAVASEHNMFCCLFRASPGSISYEGGAICSDSEITLFSPSISFTMSQGHIEAPNGNINIGGSCEISNSYVSIRQFHVSRTYVNVYIKRSFLDTQSLLIPDTGSNQPTSLNYTLEDSVLRSAAESSEFDASSTWCYPSISIVDDSSVVYLTKIGSTDNLKYCNSLKYQNAVGKVDGGYVFCNQLITDDNLTNGKLDGKVNTNFAQLSGVFYKSSTNDTLVLCNLELTGGVLLSAPFSQQLNLFNNITANNAAIVILADADSPFVHVYKADSCTIAAINESASSNKIKVQIWGDVDKCNVYSTTDDIIYAGYPTVSANNSYYVPNGTVDVSTYTDGGDESYYDVYGSITAKTITSVVNPLIFHSNVCADVLEISKDVSFDGSDKYSVSFGGVTGRGTIISHYADVVDFACKKVKNWVVLDDEYGYNVSGDTQLYIGRQVFNTLADTNKTYDDLVLCKGSSVTINVPLTLPFEQWIFQNKLVLEDENGNTCDLGDVGLTADFVDGGSNSLDVVLKAGNNVKVGSYKLTYAMNGQAINKGNSISLTLSANSSHVMGFDPSTTGWSYTGSDGTQKNFTGADYGEIIEADTWTWYGKAGGEYEAKTLVLKDGFSFSTINSNGIHFAEDATVVIVGSCAINAADSAISSAGNLTIKGDGENSALTINKGLYSDKELEINGVKIATADITTISSTVDNALIHGETVFLNNCEITAGDNWKDKDVISATNKVTMSRGVTLDLPASNVKAKNIIIADIDKVDNVVCGDKELEANNSYGSESGLNTLSANDGNNRMTLSTTPFKLIGDASEIVIEDKAVFGEGSKSLLCGQRYRFDITDYISLKTGLDISPTSYQGYNFSFEHDSGKMYLVVDVPDNDKATNSVIMPEISLTDGARRGYRSGETISFTPTIGKAVRASKLGILYSSNGNYGGLKPTECYKISASVNGNDVPMRNDGVYDYFAYPANDKLNVTIIPEENHMFNNISLKTWGDIDDSAITIGPSPTGDYSFGDKGTVLSQQLCLDLDVTTGTQYKTVAISNDLIQSLTNDEIEAITLTYNYDGSEKTFDKTNYSPKYVLSNEDVTVSITAPDKFVADINGNKTGYLNGVYTIILPAVSEDIDITATLEEFTGFGEFLISDRDNVTILTPSATVQDYYKVGTECELVVKSTENKFIDTVTFNGTVIEADSTDSDGSHYKVTVASGVNDFDVTYTDCTQLTIAKPVNGTIEFTGRLDGGRSKETPADGTQIISIGAGDEVTLTVTPDKGYRVKSATLNGKEVTLTDGKYTFTIEAGTEFSVEFEEIPPTNASVIVKCGEHGTVSPATSDYPIGTEVTLTVTPDSGYRVKSATMDGKEVTLTDGRYTFTLTADCEFSVEFEEIPAANATVTVKCGEHGTVTPATAEYPIGTAVTLTVTPDSGYRVKSATMDGKAVTLTDGKYTFTLTADCEFSVEFEKTSNGGNNGGSHSGSSTSTGTSEPVPALNGESRSWSDIASSISKMNENSTVEIFLNGATSVPADVLKEIRNKKITATIKFDDYKSWTIDGSKITSDHATANLYLLPGTSSANGARGIAGYRFTTGGNDVEARLNVQFKSEHAGKFANLYFIKDGRAEFVSTAKISENGCVTLPGAAAKGEYVIMLCDYSDLLGDANNDGVVNALDVAAILKDIVEIAKCANPQMGDYNTSGSMNALDAAEILKRIVRK